MCEKAVNFPLRFACQCFYGFCSSMLFACNDEDDEAVLCISMLQLAWVSEMKYFVLL